MALHFDIIMFLIFCNGVISVLQEINDRPIIGILTQEVEDYLYPYVNYTSYIAASYVKGLETAGARVVPIMINRDRKYYEKLMGHLNGAVLPGGAVSMIQGGFAEAGRLIYDIAKKMNDQGIYFPLFGICLGFEFFIILDTEPDNRVRCKALGNFPLIVTKEYRSSKMFKDINIEDVNLLETQNITIHSHHYCITDENMERFNLKKHWRATSRSIDNTGLQFLSSIEHKRYPFYGLQFHPEKTMFEWKKSKGFVHFEEAIRVNRYFYDFFIHECRKNNQSFESEDDENEALIYNYDLHFTGAHKEAGLYNVFTQCYFFEPLEKNCLNV